MSILKNLFQANVESLRGTVARKALVESVIAAIGTKHRYIDAKGEVVLTREVTPGELLMAANAIKAGRMILPDFAEESMDFIAKALAEEAYKRLYVSVFSDADVVASKEAAVLTSKAMLEREISIPSPDMTEEERKAVEADLELVFSSVLDPVSEQEAHELKDKVEEEKPATKQESAKIIKPAPKQETKPATATPPKGHKQCPICKEFFPNKEMKKWGVAKKKLPEELKGRANKVMCSTCLGEAKAEHDAFKKNVAQAANADKIKAAHEAAEAAFNQASDAVLQFSEVNDEVLPAAKHLSESIKDAPEVVKTTLQSSIDELKAKLTAAHDAAKTSLHKFSTALEQVKKVGGDVASFDDLKKELEESLAKLV